VVLKNVVGILRGSDPVLKNTCVVLSAHYDHIGVKPKAEGDRIYNGANDDGSGTVSVIEIANALSRLEPHPKRTIVFVTFFGEEKGLFGSHYYASHPAIPLKDTIADINLEQMGRTDSSEGPEVGTVSMTGYDYTDLVDTIRDATSLTGVKLHKNSQNSELYFVASDNLSFAEKGVPAHTFAVAYDFPDYHGVGDEWPKIDYSNMGKVDRAFALAVVMLADGSEIPHWNTHNLKAAQYLKSWEENHGGK
jgi:Zn-dependent M28 family amino/carboxypeptidase